MFSAFHNQSPLRPLCLLSKTIINSWCMYLIKSLGQDRSKWCKDQKCQMHPDYWHIMETYLKWTRVIMSYIHKQSVGDAWNKRLYVWGMHERTNGFTTIAINQTSFFMWIMCIQSLCQRNGSINSQLLCLFRILFHFLLRLSTYLIFVKKLNLYSLMF